MARIAERMRTIGAKIFFAFFAVCLALALYGAWSVGAISDASRIVKDTYDRPLQAINFARSAHTAFYRARNIRMSDPSGRSGAFAEQVELFREDLEVAAERSLTEDSRTQIAEIGEAFERWLAVETLPDSFGALQSAMEDGRAADLTARFDLLIETMATESFLERQRAVEQVDRSVRLGVISVLAAFTLAVSLALLLSRMIGRPLAFAASVADKVSLGDFGADIPQGGGDETGALLRSMRVMQTNIHEMMAREERRRMSAEARMADALESANAAIVLLDERFNVIYANSKIADYFPDIRAAVDGGAPLFAVLETAEISFTNGGSEGQSLIAGLENGDEIQTAEGVWLRVSRSAMRDGGVVMVLADISDIKEREQRLKIATGQAEAASRAKTRFLANISHELKTPLHNIIGFSEIIHNESFGPLGSADYKDYAKYILTGGRRLLELILDVLEIARQADESQDAAMEPVSAAQIVAAAVARISEEAQKAGVAIDVDPAFADGWIWGEKEKLERALANILSNAVKFSPRDARVAITSRKEGGFISIIVADRGIGMRPEDVPLALSAFDQVDGALGRKFEGAGVGLPYAKSVIDRHGGRIDIQTAPGEGATVTVRLLNAAEVAAGALAIPAPSARSAA